MEELIFAQIITDDIPSTQLKVIIEAISAYHVIFELMFLGAHWIA